MLNTLLNTKQSISKQGVATVSALYEPTVLLFGDKVEGWGQRRGIWRIMQRQSNNPA